jgi:RHS repeat-associated protein
VLTYDLQNRLTSDSVQLGSAAATVTTYGYDTNGNRVSKTDATGTVGYTIDEMNPTGYAQVIEEWDGPVNSQPGDPSFDHPDVTYLLGSTVLGQSDGTKHNSFFQTDGHGSTRAILDATGQVATGQIFAYDAYGNRLSTGSTITPATTILFSGQQFDTGLGMYDLRARFYDPRSGRFSSFDSQENSISDPQSLHKYLYANGNPVMSFDPSGHEGLPDQLISNSIRTALFAMNVASAIGNFNTSIRYWGKAWEYYQSNEPLKALSYHLAASWHLLLAVASAYGAASGAASFSGVMPPPSAGSGGVVGWALTLLSDHPEIAAWVVREALPALGLLFAMQGLTGGGGSSGSKRW